MRISDWSSDVCSSDLASDAVEYDIADPAFHPFDWDSMRMLGAVLDRRIARLQTGTGAPADASDEYLAALEIGREACRERVCQYVYISVVAVSLNKKTNRSYKHYKAQHQNKIKI